MRVDALWIHPGCAHDASARPKVGEKSRSLRCRLATWVLVPRLPCRLDASRSNAKDAGVIVPARLTTDPIAGRLATTKSYRIWRCAETRALELAVGYHPPMALCDFSTLAPVLPNDGAGYAGGAWATYASTGHS